MDLVVKQIIVLILFCALMLAINLKAGTRDWSGALLKWGTYLLLLTGMGALAWKVLVFAL